jgi:hypothetical protein
MRSLKYRLKYFLVGKRDVALIDIIRQFDMREPDLPHFEQALRELELENWIIRVHCEAHHREEYEPGYAQVRNIQLEWVGNRATQM